VGVDSGRLSAYRQKVRESNIMNAVKPNIGTTLKVILGVGALVFLALVFILLIGSITPSQEIVPQSSRRDQATLASPPPTPAVSHMDPTAGWKAYKNEMQGYSMKYPSDWFFASEGEATFRNRAIFISNYDTQKFSKSFEKDMLKIQISVNPIQIEDGQTIKEWFAEHPYYGQRPTEDSPGLYPLPIEMSEQKVGGIPALRVLTEEGAPGGLSRLSYFFPVPSTRFLLVVSATPGNSDLLDTFELIVSSLRFSPS